MATPPPPEPTPPPAQPGPPPPPPPDASSADWHAWRHAQRDYMRGQWRDRGWYGPGAPWLGRGWFWGAVLVFLGVIFLLQNLGLLYWVRGEFVWPVLLILFGVALIVGRGRWWR